MQLYTFKESLPLPRLNYSRVFRVESVHNTHQGAYESVAHDINDWVHLPTPYNDVGIERRMRSHEVCGAEWERLLNWFPEYIIAKLHAYELQLLALDVPNNRITKGEFQVIFVRDEAVVVAAFQSSANV